ncbi:Acb2/Tad1 domain-containing protein [Corynebacterium stationis]|uniref:Acb2/Tad1 domain-containing protein n=1 Tax=Corynebacterium stationis TaxID=1705 RepID=UPI003F4E24B4
MDAHIENTFTYHDTKDEVQEQKYVTLRQKTKELAYLYEELCPPSRERSLALTNLEQSNMWANASIARNK